MKVIGIVCEYDPFHRGHAHHLARTREAAGEDACIVCCMSGDFVQRGAFASFPKAIRAEAAVRGGADLVVELPIPWAVASAPRFAAGAVSVLGALGCDAISFGAQAGDAAALSRGAEQLCSPVFDEALREALSTGMSFASARAEAAVRAGVLPALLEDPNANLGLEYLRAAREQGLCLDPLVIPRQGAGHDAPADGGPLLSASAIREALRRDREDLSALPEQTAPLFAGAVSRGLGPVFTEEQALPRMAALRRMSPEDLAALPDMSEGFEHRLWEAVRDSVTPEEAADRAKTKRFAHARIRRQLLLAYLGFTSADGEGLPPYANILAFNHRGRAHLSRYAGALPLVNKPGRRELSPAGERLFRKEAVAADLYALALPDPAARAGGSAYRFSPVYVQDAE